MATKKSTKGAAGSGTRSKKKAPAAGKKKPAGKKAGSSKKAGSGAPKQAGGAPAAGRKAKDSGARAAAVNMGHIFALRPRAVTSFPQQALHEAKLALAEESFASITDAARAVAERALEITHDGARPGRARNRGPSGG